MFPSFLCVHIYKYMPKQRHTHKIKSLGKKDILVNNSMSPNVLTLFHYYHVVLYSQDLGFWNINSGSNT